MRSRGVRLRRTVRRGAGASAWATLRGLPGARLGFLVGRNRTGKGTYASAWVGSSFHTPSRYGNLQL